MSDRDHFQDLAINHRVKRDSAQIDCEAVCRSELCYKVGVPVRIPCELIVVLVEVELNDPFLEGFQGDFRVLYDFSPVCQVGLEHEDVETIVRQDVEGVGPVTGKTEHLEPADLLLGLLREGVE